MKKLLFIVYGLVMFSFMSCEKEEIRQKESIFSVNAQVIDNTLHFQSGEDFMKALDEANHILPEKKFDWEKRNNFMSQNRIYIELLEQYADVTIEEEEALIATYEALFLFSEEGEITPKIQGRGVMPLVNEEGIVYVGGSVYYFNEEGEYTAKNKPDLEKLIRTGESNANNGIFFHENVRDNDQRSACGVYQTRTVYNSSNNRKGRITARVEFYFTFNGTGTYTAESYLRVNGTPSKKNWGGKWRSYKTNNILNINCYVQSFGLQNYPFQPQPGNVTFEDYGHDHDSSNYWWGIQYWERVVSATNVSGSDIGHYQCFYQEMWPNQYKSQGAPWAVINCD